MVDLIGVAGGISPKPCLTALAMLIKHILALLGVFVFMSAAAAASEPDYDKGVALYKESKYADAARAFNEAVRQNPSNASAYYYLALCYHLCKQDADARKLFSAIVDRFPKEPAAKLAATALSQMEPASAASPDRTDVAVPGNPAKDSPRSSSDKIPAPLVSGRDSRADKSGGLPDSATFHFKRDLSGHMMVDCHVNGHPITAMFDTGASTFFNKADLQAAGIDVSKATPAGFTQGWAGKRVPVWRLLVDVKLGNLSRRLPIEMQDQTEGVTTGLVGQDFVDGYEYGIDAGAGRIDLKRQVADANEHYDSLYDIPCEHGDQDDYVQVELNGKKTKAFIDTGAFTTIIDPLTASRLNIEPCGEIARGAGVGGSITMQVAYITMSCGPIKRENFRICIGGSGGTAIGQDFMQGWRCKVDREHHLLRFFH